MTHFERLPKTVIPVNYNLELEPDLKNFTFKGHAIIDVDVCKKFLLRIFILNFKHEIFFILTKVKSETNKILLNSAELTFDKATFEHGSTKVVSKKVELCEKSEVATITFDEPLKHGHGKLHITYTGILNDKLKGFYRSKYIHPSGEERYSATTQFEVEFFKFN